MVMPRTGFVWLAGLLLSTNCAAIELSGNVSVQGRYFFSDALDPRQHNTDISFATEPEFYTRLGDSNHSLTFTPFYRYDQRDDERSHGDIRELAWLGVFDGWELTAGISKVFWGVTETQHLVDIINQTDLIENIDGEDKLGQPMIRFSTIQDFGIIDFFILPGFRERTFAGVEGRPRPGFVIDSGAASYESSDADRHIDAAIRWLMLFDNWELGLSHFSGTGREPVAFLPVPGQPGVLAPYYALIEQSGLTVQALIEDWTFKLEAIRRRDPVADFVALTGGFEYTFVGVSDSATDLGVVIEYLFDDRDRQATSPFQNDLATGLRISLNDIQSTEILVGFITDLDDHTVAAFLEGSRRLGRQFRLELEIRNFAGTVPGRPLHDVSNDDFIQADLAWYF